MKKSVAFALLFSFVIALHAHEFWMQPRKYKIARGESWTIDFMVGEDFLGEPWNLQKSRLVRFDMITSVNTEKLIDQAKEGKGNNLTLTPQREGGHLIVMESTNAFIEMEGDKFVEYLKEDGLDDIYEIRKKKNILDKPAREHYARCTKLLLQSGSKADNIYSKEVGLPLEIIPLQNPYTAKAGDEMKFKVLCNGKPLEYALVKVWNRKDNRTFIQNIYTEEDGVIMTRFSNTGAWMVSTVKMIESKDPAADYQSYWASLVFGFD